MAATSSLVVVAEVLGRDVVVDAEVVRGRSAVVRGDEEMVAVEMRLVVAMGGREGRLVVDTESEAVVTELVG